MAANWKLNAPSTPAVWSEMALATVGATFASATATVAAEVSDSAWSKASVHDTVTVMNLPTSAWVST